MKIAVNTRLLLSNKLDGIGWFTYETLKGITLSHSEIEFCFIFDRPYSGEFIFNSNVKPLVIGPPTRHPFLWYAWFEYSVPYILKKIKPDLFLSTDGYLSLSTDVPSVDVIHDINFYHRPKDLPFWMRRYYRYYFPKFAKKSARLATVSEYSKADIAANYHIDPAKIDVVYNGTNTAYKPLNEANKENVKEQFTSGHDFFIFIGNMHPRKNISRLLQAFERFKDETQLDFKLIIVGTKFFKTTDISDVLNIMKFRSDVIFFDHQPPEILGNLIGAAFALTFVPLFEGFGIPNLEAMYCDVPVITSNVTSIPEIVGEAALFTNPYSVDSIKEAMVKIVKDNNFRNDLIEKGRIQRKLYSWDKTAERLWKTIEKVIK